LLIFLALIETRPLLTARADDDLFSICVRQQMQEESALWKRGGAGAASATAHALGITALAALTSGKNQKTGEQKADPKEGEKAPREKGKLGELIPEDPPPPPKPAPEPPTLAPPVRKKVDAAAAAEAAEQEDVPIRSRDDLMAEARKAVDDWLTTGVATPVSGEFLIQADLMNLIGDDAQFAVNQAVHGYRELLYNVRQQVRGLDLKSMEAVQVVRSAASETLRNYCSDRAKLSDFYSMGCGNCEAETKLVLALMNDAGVSPPEGSQFGIQLYDDHIQPVVYTSASHEAQGLVAKSVETPALAPVYQPVSAYYRFLVSNGSPESKETEEKLTLDPGIPPEEWENGHSPQTNTTWNWGRGNGRAFSSSMPPEYATIDLQPLDGVAGPRGGSGGLGGFIAGGANFSHSGTGYSFRSLQSYRLSNLAALPVQVVVSPDHMPDTGYVDRHQVESLGFANREDWITLSSKPTQEEMRAQHIYRASEAEAGKWDARTATVLVKDPKDAAALGALSSTQQQFDYMEKMTWQRLQSARKGRELRDLTAFLDHPEGAATASATVIDRMGRL
jgi:hypothetical protein